MRILVVGATGTIGKAVVEALRAGNEIIEVSQNSTPLTVDISDAGTIRAMYEKVEQLDAVVCAAGAAKFMPLADLDDSDFDFSLRNKLMGQVNLVRYGFDRMSDGGSFTIVCGKRHGDGDRPRDRTTRIAGHRNRLFLLRIHDLPVPV